MKDQIEMKTAFTRPARNSLYKTKSIQSKRILSRLPNHFAGQRLKRVNFENVHLDLF